MDVPSPAVQFLRLDNGQRLAFTSHGEGPALVCPAWWVSHLEDDWADEGFRELFGGLAEHFQVVRYDRPGSGLSDRNRDEISLADEVATLEQLIDHLDLDQVSLFSVSCAGPPALAYAGAHPERVAKLVFFGSFMRGADVGPAPMKDALQGLVRVHWGMASRTITNLFAPRLDGDDVERMSRAHRRAASPEMAAQLVSLTFDADAAGSAKAVQCPALVLHRRGDRTIRIDAGRELAASLPSARFTTLEGDEHVPWMGDIAAVRVAILDFLEAQPAAPRGGGELQHDADPSLRKRGDVWTAVFDGVSVHLKHARGLTDLAVLLAHPNQDVHVGMLWSGAETAAMGGGEDPVVDDEALASYRKRFSELEESIGDAEEVGNVDGAERLKEERDALAHELRGAVALGGRKRKFADPSQRARKAVSARIRASIKKISEVHGPLGEHLETSVSTGMSCSYAPSSEAVWHIERDG